MRRRLRRIIGIGLYKRENAQLPFFHEELRKHDYAYYAHQLGTERTSLIFLKALFVPQLLSKYDLVITSEYFSSFAVNLRLLLTGSKTKHVTIGLNQSRKLLKTRIRLVDSFFNFVFRRTDLVVVHSRREIELFATIHDLPLDKFYFSLWGFDLPKITPSKFSQWPKPYVCLVGRNNRDIETFLAAVSKLDIDGVVITSRSNAPKSALPSNVHLFWDIPLNDSLDCIRNSVANLILLKDNERGAGHITAVAAMFARVPQIFTDAEAIKDYLVNGASAVAVPLYDVHAVRQAIQRILKEPTQATHMTANALSYAQRWLTNERVSERIMIALNKVVNCEKVETVDAEWLLAYEHLEEIRRNMAVSKPKQFDRDEF